LALDSVVDLLVADDGKAIANRSREAIQANPIKRMFFMRSPFEKAVGESLCFEYCLGLLESSGIYHDQLPIANIIADCRLPTSLPIADCRLAIGYIVSLRINRQPAMDNAQSGRGPFPRWLP
jgi:hypothetical protein